MSKAETFEAKLAVYSTRLFIELDAGFCEETFQVLPGHVQIYPLDSNGGCIGLRFINKGNRDSLIVSRRKGKWIVELNGARALVMRKHLGNPLYGVSPTTALYFPKSGIIRIKQPTFQNRYPVRNKTQASVQTQLI